MNNISTNWKDFYQNSQEDISNNINIIFDYKNMKYNEMCNYNEKVRDVIKRWSDKYGVNKKGLKFVFNAKNLCERLTVAEAGIINMSQIFVISTTGIKGAPGDQKQDNDKDNQNYEEISEQIPKKINITFKTTQGSVTNIYVNEEHSIGTAIKKYLISIDNAELITRLENGDKSISFLYNAKLIKINDKKKVKDFFVSYDRCIIVNDVTNLIGA